MPSAPPSELPQLPFRTDISVERRPSNPQLIAEVRNDSFTLPHRSLGHSDLCFCQNCLPAADMASSRAEASPAIVRSRMSSRSNSARDAKIPNTSLPLAFVVSISLPCRVQLPHDKHVTLPGPSSTPSSCYGIPYEINLIPFSSSN